MARVRVTVQIAGGYPHREHRSKKGRKKKVFSEQKPPAYPVYLENDKLILEKNDRFKVMDNPEEFKETLTLGDVLDLPPAPNKVRGGYPKLVCENCGHLNQLHFSAIEEWGKMTEVVCSNCRELAYYAFYWKDYQVKDALAFMSRSLVRELIRAGKTTLLNLKNLW